MTWKSDNFLLQKRGFLIFSNNFSITNSLRSIVKTVLYDTVAVPFIKFITLYYTYFRSQYGPVVDSASNRNEYQEHFLGVKAAGA